MLRVAVIGAGSIGTRHVGNLLALGCDVLVHDLDEHRAASAVELGARFTNNNAILFACQAMVIATPYNRHFHWAEWATRSGLPFFIEKPIGDVSELTAWRQLAYDARDLVTQVGYQCRFHPTFTAMQRLAPVDRGLFETLCDMRAWPGQHYGPLIVEASHDIDLALALGADPVVTQAYVTPDDISFGLGDGCSVHLRDRVPQYLRRWKVERAGECLSAWFNNPRALVANTYRDEMAHFLKCVRERKQTDVPLSDGVRVLEVCQHVEQMAARAA